MASCNQRRQTRARSSAAAAAVAADVLASPELVLLITRRVAAGDVLAWALACRGFRAAQVQLCSAPPAAGEEAPAWVGEEGALVSPAKEFLSLTRAEWISTEWADGGHMVPIVEDQEDFCTLAVAKLGGRALKTLKALRAGGFAWTAATCSKAAGGGHLQVLRWLGEQGCPWGVETCAEAARGGHLEVLKWLRAPNPAVIAVGFFAFGGVRFDPLNAAGMAVGMAGSVWYAAVKLKSK